MLFQIGPLTCDTFPFEVGGWDRDHAADFADHDVISRPKDPEAVGDGDDEVTITGQLLPLHIGGLSELELAHGLASRQDPLFVMRGDGGLSGWFTLRRVRERHGKDGIAPGGVGYTVAYELHLRRCPRPGQAAGISLMATLAAGISSLFG